MKGNPASIFDAEDQFTDLVNALPEPLRPITITPEHLRINLFQPPSDLISINDWREHIAFLLRSEMFIRDGAQNLFNETLTQLFKTKGVFTGGTQFPSLIETLSYLQSYQLHGKSKRGKEWMETLINRLQMLVNTYEQTAHATNSNMLELLADKPVIFRLQNIRGIPLQFLTNFLLTWLLVYKQGRAKDGKVHTIFLDEEHFYKVAPTRNDIGTSTIQAVAATGAKRGLRLVLTNQLISKLDEELFANMGCRVITRLTSGKDIRLIQQSMGLSPSQAESITRLQKREIIISYSDYQLPFKARVHEFTFPPAPDEMALEKNAQDFLSKAAWTEDDGQTIVATDPHIVEGDARRVFERIAKEVETIEERFEALNLTRSREQKARDVLKAKGFITEDEITIGNRMKLFALTPKGEAAAEKMGIKVKRFKSGRVHEYILYRIGKKLCSLNPQYKLQRNSEIAREYGIQPDSVLNMTLGYRAIMEIICSNVKREAEILNRERTIDGVDIILAITANKTLAKSLRTALKNSLFQEQGDTKIARIEVLDAGTCLDEEFDWVPIFEKP